MTLDLDRLGDELEISRLMQAYCSAYDAGRWQETAQLFERGVWYISGEIALKGVDEVASFLDASIRLYDGVPKTRHALSNIRIDVSEDRSTASSESVVVVFQSPPEEAPRILIQATYQDRFAREDGAWHFAERRASVDGTGDLTTHFKAAEPTAS